MPIIHLNRMRMQDGDRLAELTSGDLGRCQCEEYVLPLGGCES